MTAKPSLTHKNSFHRVREVLDDLAMQVSTSDSVIPVANDVERCFVSLCYNACHTMDFCIFEDHEFPDDVIDKQKQYVKSYLKIGNIENPRKDVANPNVLIYDQFSMKPKIQ